jgi:polyhydroxyalkanoate synthase
VPLLLVFALINRPEIFDSRPGSSLIEFLLDEGFDVFLVDWGFPTTRTPTWGSTPTSAMSLRATRERLRASGEEELTLVGWCIGGTLCAIYAALHPDTPLRNLILLTTPVDTNGSLYRKWVGRDSFDVDYVSDVYQAVPGQMIDWANKLMKPVTNYWTTYRRLREGVSAGEARREAYQLTARWVADNPPSPSRAYRHGSPRCTRRISSCAAG